MSGYTDEERREARRQTLTAYSRSAKGKATYARYRQTEGYREAQERYGSTVDKAAAASQWAKDNPTRRRRNIRHWLLKQYGLTLDQYRDMEVGQAGRCLICLRVPPKAFHVDHDHLTGQVRGLLCGPCNRMLGQSDDQPVRLRRAAAYLERSR